MNYSIDWDGPGERDRELPPGTDAVVKRLVDLFLAWPLPKSVRSDVCATMDYPYPRSGTNLLTADEARQMIEHLLAPEIAQLLKCEKELRRIHKMSHEWGNPAGIACMADDGLTTKRVRALLWLYHHADKHREKMLETLRWINAQSNLFFAECSQAEEIVTRTRDAIAPDDR